MGVIGRRHLAWVVCLGVAALVFAVWLQRNYGWGNASAIVTVIAFPTMAVGAYVAVAALLPFGRAAERADLDALADDLAVAVRRQWQAEERLRRVKDPRSLPVRWRATPAALGVADAWADVEGAAANGAKRGLGDFADAPALATRPEDLDGEFGQVADRFLAVPSRRLLIVGEPGAGKTVLVMRLTLDLLARRRPGGPVPALVSAASWNPAERDLTAWLAEQLADAYPGLAATVATTSGPSRVMSRESAMSSRELPGFGSWSSRRPRPTRREAWVGQRLHPLSSRHR